MTRHDPFSLEGKRVLLTGATAGIGARFARVLHEAGALVGLVARRHDRLAEIAAALPGSVPLPTDLSSMEQIEGLGTRALQELGGVDVLVNNAAWISGSRAEDETVDEIRRTLDVNLVAPIRLGQLVFPGMKAQGSGVIINVSSIVARVGIGRLPQATYAASKGGLEAITREWAAQWSRYGVRVNAIAPGFFETEMTDSVLAVDKIRDWVTANTLLPRTGRLEDLDGAILYLASDASSFVTGQVIVVDGGWTAR